MSWYKPVPTLTQQREGKRKGVQCSMCFLHCRGHRRDFHQLLVNWTCNPDVTASHVVMPIKNFPHDKDSSPQDLHYVLCTSKPTSNVNCSWLLFIGRAHVWIGSHKTPPAGIPCILNWLFLRVFVAGKEDQEFIKNIIWNGHWVWCTSA